MSLELELPCLDVIKVTESDCLLATEVRVRKLSIYVSDDPSAEVRTSLYVT